MNSYNPCLSRYADRAQSGLALIVALIALAAMSIAGIALIRSVDTGALIAGNIAFRQSASTSGDAGTEAARTWLITHTGSTLWNDNPSGAYYATHQSGSDLTGNKTPADTSDDFDWSSKAFCLAKDSAGNTVCYAIHRQCNFAGDPTLPATDCPTDKTSSVAKDDSKGIVRPMATYQPRGTIVAGTSSCAGFLVFYRITMRIAGPRNNVSHVQSLIQVQGC